MATYKPIIFSGSNHIKADGTTNIKIRLYHNTQSQYIPTNYYISPDQMTDSGNVTGQNSELLNYELGNIIQKYRGSEIKLGIERAKRMSCSELKNFIIASCEPDYEFIDFIAFSNEYIESVVKAKTKEWLQESLNSFVWYINKKSIDARDVTSNLISAYRVKMETSGRKKKPLQPGTISNYLRGLSDLYNACKNQYNVKDHDIIRITNEPFSDGVIPKYRRAKRSITVDQIKQIRDFKTQTKRQEIAQDMFMCMFYLMGINVNDLFHINPPGRDNRLVYNRSKTQTDDNIAHYPLSIHIEPELRLLLDKYSDRGFLSTIKLRYSNSYNFMKAINKGLDEITEELHINKITTNWARHSWATIARNKARIDKSDIDFCLGHVNNDTKMADIYIDIDYSIFDECNRKVLDLIK